MTAHEDRDFFLTIFRCDTFDVEDREAVLRGGFTPAAHVSPYSRRWGIEMMWFYRSAFENLVTLMVFR